MRKPPPKSTEGGGANQMILIVVGVQYMILWLRVKTHTTPVDVGYGMNFLTLL
jgi:hypothetical protein